MAEQPQQQPQQKQGGQKSADGIQVGLSINPKDLSKETLSGGFAILALGTVGTLVLAHVINPIRKVLFGITEEVKPAVQPQDIVNVLKSPDFKDGQRSWLVKEAFGAMDDSSKAKIKEWLTK